MAHVAMTYGYKDIRKISDRTADWLKVKLKQNCRLFNNLIFWQPLQFVPIQILSEF